MLWCGYYCTYVILWVLLYWCYCVGTTVLMLLCGYYGTDVTQWVLLCWCYYVGTTPLMLLSEYCFTGDAVSIGVYHHLLFYINQPNYVNEIIFNRYLKGAQSLSSKQLYDIINHVWISKYSGYGSRDRTWSQFYGDCVIVM